MFLFREIDYIQTYIYQIWYKILSFKQITFSKYAPNLKTTLYQVSFYHYFNLIFLLKCLIDIINMSVSRHQSSHQWQCSIIATCLCLYNYVTMINSICTQRYKEHHCNSNNSPLKSRVIQIYVYSTVHFHENSNNIERIYTF